jgi:tetratricopeptide (TPR) repeat protein
MSFFSKLVKPYRKGEKNFDRARAAEFRRDFDKARTYYQEAAVGFDEHLADKRAKGEEIRPSHLAMAGLCYTRLGRYEDALATLDECLGRKEIPDAFLYAGFAAARLDRLDKAVAYWKAYPTWADQRILANVLKEQIAALGSDSPNIDEVCDAIISGVYEQDQYNRKDRNFRRGEERGAEFRQWY